MNLQKLFEMQKELDDRILAKHPVQPGEDRLAKKILALMVELGELCQEWRGFKFWSNDQEPRTEVKIPCRFCGGYGEGYFAGHKWTGKKEKCIVCNGTGIMGVKNPLLEEYVDCLHFTLSIGLDILDDLEINPEPIFCNNIVSQFNELFAQVSYFWNVIDRDDDQEEIETEYERIWSLLFGIAGLLGFTWKQIELAYIAKNEENFRRQENGY